MKGGENDGSTNNNTSHTANDAATGAKYAAIRYWDHASTDDTTGTPDAAGTRTRPTRPARNSCSYRHGLKTV
jgi:hypothetical protein